MFLWNTTIVTIVGHDHGQSKAKRNPIIWSGIRLRSHHSLRSTEFSFHHRFLTVLFFPPSFDGVSAFVKEGPERRRALPPPRIPSLPPFLYFSQKGNWGQRGNLACHSNLPKIETDFWWISSRIHLAGSQRLRSKRKGGLKEAKGPRKHTGDALIRTVSPACLSRGGGRHSSVLNGFLRFDVYPECFVDVPL